MKICLIGNFTSSYGQICDERWIAESLEQLGHEIIRINREHLAADMDSFEGVHVDATIFFKWRGFVPEDIKLWRETVGGPILAWTFDFMPIHDYFLPVLKEVDLWLGEELGLLPRWKEMGIKFHYFPNHAVPPQIFQKINAPKEFDVSFTGTHFATGGRVDLLTEVDKHFDLHVFGNGGDGWKTDVKNVHQPAFDDQLAIVIGLSKIMLGINIENNTWGYWSIRPAQVMMCGGFMLQKYVPGMEKELKDGVEYFRDTRECIEKIRYYLEHDEEREKIAFRGQAIALCEMTNQARSRELVTLLKNYPF